MTNCLNNLYQKESIYLLHYMNKNDIYTSYDSSTDISGKKITHHCCVDESSAGAPIILLKNNKVIGVNQGNTNFGMLLIDPIIEFQKISKETNYTKIIKKGKAEPSLIKGHKKYILAQKDKKVKLNSNKSDLSNKLNNEQNLKLITTIKEQFIISPLIGLQNIEDDNGGMNATLQCLCYIEGLANYFKFNTRLYDLFKEDNNKSKLFSSFKLLIDNLFPKYVFNLQLEKKNYFAPYEFKKKIKEMKEPNFDFNKLDPKDFVIFLIQNLHRELRKKKENNNNNINLDKRDKNMMFQKCSNNFIENDQSIIGDLFYGFKYITAKCPNCDSTTYDFQPYLFLDFPLDKIHILKSNATFLGNFPAYELNLLECFLYKENESIISDNGINNCDYCNTSSFDISLKTKLYSGPLILIIILNRGKGIYNDMRVQFHQEIDLTQFIELQCMKWTYKLIGVISLVDKNIDKKHFIAFCRNPVTNSWYQYNNASVNLVKDFKKEVIDSFKPYILFYQLNK